MKEKLDPDFERFLIEFEKTQKENGDNPPVEYVIWTIPELPK